MSSDASIDPGESDSEHEETLDSQTSENSPSHSPYSDREVPDTDTPTIRPESPDASPYIDSIGATPSIEFDATPSVNFDATPSINFDATPYKLFSPTNADGADVEFENELIHRERSDSISEPEPEPDPLDILSEAVTRVESLPVASNRNPVPFPLSRVKTIMRTDPDTSLVQLDAAVVIGEAAKLFLKRFSRDAQKITATSKRKIVNRADVDSCLNRYQEYSFLEEQLDW